MTSGLGMQIFTPDQYVTSQWKNGGGITHEIARGNQDGHLLWRLSLAEVDRDGPFSVFPGLHRILTVVSGAGMVLEGVQGNLPAPPFSPLTFSGDIELCGRLRSGPVRNFNLIFDPTRLCPRVTCHSGPERLRFPDHPCGVYMVSGQAGIGSIKLKSGSFVLEPNDDVALDPGATALCVELRAVNSPKN